MAVITFYCGLEHQSFGCTPPERQYTFGLPNSTDVYANVQGAVSVVAEPLWAATSGAASVDISSGMRAAADAYFTKELLRKSSSITQLGNVQWDILLSLAAVWVAVYFCIAKGIWSTERVVWVTVPLPCVLMCVLLLRGITLDG